jgi:plastocyanin
MHHWYRKAFALAVAGAWALAAGAAVRAEGWGTIKGQVVWAGDKVPERAPVKVDKDQNACLKNGPLLDERLVVNPKNKGVRWVAVYLMSADGFKKPIPIHPALKDIKQKVVEVDQPCCQFEPHVLAVRVGQTLVFKNSAAISHNVKVDPVPSINQIVPPGKELKLTDLTARNLPLQIACNIHPWMSGKVFVLPHPYFAVTDENGKFEIKNAPAGAFRLVVWQEEAGWVVYDDAKKRSSGKKITIKDKETTDLGKIPLKVAKD